MDGLVPGTAGPVRYRRSVVGERSQEVVSAAVAMNTNPATPNVATERVLTDIATSGDTPLSHLVIGGATP